MNSWTTPVVRKLMWANGAVFLAALFTQHLPIWNYLALVPATLIHKKAVWSAFTYMYVHFDLMHLLTNLFGLWIFGPDVERVYGGRRFFLYYTICGLGAAAVACVAYPLSGIVGASGAIYGVLLAFAVLFPYRPVYLFGVAPIEARYLAILYGVIDLIGGIQNAGGGSAGYGGGVAHLAHLGGLAAGGLYHLAVGKFRLSLPNRPGIFQKFMKALKPAKPKSPKTTPGQRLSESELDALLDKISKNGMNSLTPEERRRLKEASASLRK